MKLGRIVLCVLVVSAVSWGNRQVGTKGSEGLILSREFDFTYSVRLPNLPQNSRSLRIWIPVASTTQHQTVKLLKMSGALPTSHP